MIIRSRAPLRISFCGGGTDVSPYPEEKGGVVLSTTIDKYSYASLIPKKEPVIQVKSLDFDIVAKYDVDRQLVYDGELDLVKGVINTLLEGKGEGFVLFIHSDAPPGSGLGSSSTMAVTLIGLVRQWLQKPWTNYDIAQLAYHIEREILGIKGGKQDQYAAAFGGFNFIEFYRDYTVVNPLRISPIILNELEYHLLLCYTGKTRLSARIIETQVKGYIERQAASVAALDELKQITIDMKNALLQGRLSDFGALLHDAWMNKKRLAEQISNETIDTLYETARKHGALGGKILGAGGGGYLLLYCPFDKKHIIAQELEKAGGQVVKFGFEQQGLQTWELDGSRCRF
ncbi:MAG TPA: GHMP kinase [Firmicutes bacterium]|nr:GHMP kinase [Bacillota bacterium]